MKYKVSEKRIVDVLASYLRKSGNVAQEVRHYERRIDVATVVEKGDEVWAIEAKVSNWVKGISQAITNLTVSNKSYIAMYNKYSHRVPMSALEKYGIGLIAVGARWGEVEIIKEASESPYINRIAIERIRNRIQDA